MPCDGVLVITPVDAKRSPRVDRKGREVLPPLDAVLDRSHLMVAPPKSPNRVERSGSAKSSDDLEH